MLLSYCECVCVVCVSASIKILCRTLRSVKTGILLLYRLKKLWLICLFLLVTASAFAYKNEVINGKVIQVKDGDTVVIAPAESGQFFTCRLYGIDTPEISHGRKPGQPYGEEAAKELKRLVLGQAVEITTTGAKTYKREVCIIRKDCKDINLEMVKRGYAWAYKQYLKKPYASEYIETENEARIKRLGCLRGNLGLK